MFEPEKILVLDIETANSTEDAICYDCGFAVSDRKGRIYEKHSYLVYDIYRGERTLMETAYYAEKIPLYEEKIKRGEIKIISFMTLWKIVRQTIRKYEIKKVAAYNANFDYTGLNTTIRFITKSKFRWFFPYGTKIMCIWHMASQVICCQPTYQRWARNHGYISEAGNIKTSAEVVYKYITCDHEFEEEHTGLADVLIECQIMAHCYRQHKKMKTHPSRFAWRVANTKALKEKYGVKIGA